MINGVYAYYVLFKVFPQEMNPVMVKHGVLDRLIKLVSFFNDRKVAYIILEIVEQAQNEISCQEYQNSVMPYIIDLSKVNYDLGVESSVFRPREIKIKTYKVLKQAL